jgi:hypothetical protein
MGPKCLLTRPYAHAIQRHSIPAWNGLLSVRRC